ncbi:TIGR03086 family metal-binding protein [Nocardioides sp. MAHUQ-72]|uniref:TIGR03086 family metal-binding protein n=1 Tax=unclassified Nocardioides TaxID=2615069 RepID=UPI00362063B4
MTPPLDGAVELLERALAYTRGALASVDETSLAGPTPCRGWTLGVLLDHMDDALLAFTEAAEGWVPVGPTQPGGTRVATLQDRACALLGAWTHAAPGVVRVGDRPVHASLLVATAALEVTVHGWDVAQATGLRTPLPQRLARDLLPVALETVTPADRGSRFAPARPATDAAYDARLLAFLGRDLTGPPVPNPRNPGTGPQRAP